MTGILEQSSARRSRVAASGCVDRPAVAAQGAGIRGPGRDLQVEQGSVRDGKGLGREAAVHDRTCGEDAAARRGHRVDDLAGGFPRREDILDDGDRIARLDAEAAAESEDAVLSLREEKGRAEGARDLVADDEPAESWRD